MTVKPTRQDQFRWRLLLYAAAGSVILYVPVMAYAWDVGGILYMFLIVPVVTLLLLLAALIPFLRGRRLMGLSMLAALGIYCAISWSLFHNSVILRSLARWYLGSSHYESQVLAQPVPPNGELRHVEWEGWGFAGADTTMYLVFDPGNSLWAAARSGSPGKFPGIPCNVLRVRRLASHWYTVLFYTETAWNYCG